MSEIKNQKSKIGSIFIFLLFSISYLVSQEGARYLIITHDNFYDCIQPLAQWKMKKGMMPKVVKLSEIGSTSEAIRNYIVRAYNNWSVKPEYLLLVGSPSLLPSYFYSSGQNIRIYTDNYYGNVSGDYRAEIPYGRFPCKTLSQCSVMVYKTLYYEKSLFLSPPLGKGDVDSLWMVKGMGIINEDGSSDDTIYWNNVRFACQLMEQQGFVHIDTFSKFRGHSSNDIIQGINDGRGIILYRGPGQGNWYQPFTVHPSLVNNGMKLPIIASITCQTMSLAAFSPESMVGEVWLQVGTASLPKGAVAFFGNTHSGSKLAPVRGVCTRGFFRNFFSDIYQLGKACLAAKESIYARFGNQVEYLGFNLFGDPELNILTASPKPLTVTHPETLQIGSQSVKIKVERCGVLTANALVCLWKEPDVYKYGYTNSLGEVSFNISPALPGEILLTVTARNSLPFEKSIICVPPTGMLEDSEERVKGRNYFLRERPLIYDAMGRRCPAVKKGVYFMEDKGGIRKLVILD